MAAHEKCHGLAGSDWPHRTIRPTGRLATTVCRLPRRHLCSLYKPIPK